MAENGRLTAQPHPRTPLPHIFPPNPLDLASPRTCSRQLPMSVSPGAGVKAGRRPPAGLGLDASEDDASEDDATLPQPGAARLPFPRSRPTKERTDR
jgi:hypothetical protein